jgi:hypothetical protein
MTSVSRLFSDQKHKSKMNPHFPKDLVFFKKDHVLKTTKNQMKVKIMGFIQV